MRLFFVRRLKFINWCATKFVELYLEELRGVGNCAIVVGERGTGKSFLLKKIAAATVDLVPSTIVCHIQYEDFDTACCTCRSNESNLQC